MSRTKFITGILLVLAVLFAQVGTVFAAPPAQDATSITGNVTDIQLETDTNGVVTAVLVTLDDGMGGTQTVRLSVNVAQNTYGLVTVDTTTNEVTVDDSKFNTTLTIQSTDVLPDEETTDEFINPVAALLAKFFKLEPSVVQGYHEEGFGFGVIAQALWMQKNLGDAEITAEMILQAKENKDFSSIILPDGSNPTNWGQFKKALLDKKNNLGVIVSGHADDGTEDTLNQTTPKENGKGKGKDNNPGKGKGNNKNP